MIAIYRHTFPSYDNVVAWQFAPKQRQQNGKSRQGQGQKEGAHLESLGIGWLVAALS